MSKHTPGPWRVVNDVDIQSGPQGCLAYVSTGGARGRTFEEAQANAQLIAAAPELLEECKRTFYDLHEGMLGGDNGYMLSLPYCHKIIKRLLTAIAKAEGETA